MRPTQLEERGSASHTTPATPITLSGFARPPLTAVNGTKVSQFINFGGSEWTQANVIGANVMATVTTMQKVPTIVAGSKMIVTNTITVSGKFRTRQLG